jgi:hypothetical protein
MTSPSAATVPTNEEIAGELNADRREILHAIQRLILGQPRHVRVGDMSIISLAREAGVGRHHLYQAHSDLKDRYEFLCEHSHKLSVAEIESQTIVTSLRLEIRRLQDLQSRTQEGAEKWKNLAETLARAVNVLQEELRQEQIRSQRLKSRLDVVLEGRGDTVIPIRPRPNI